MLIPFPIKKEEEINVDSILFLSLVRILVDID